MENDPRQLELFPGFEGSKMTQRVIEMYDRCIPLTPGGSITVERRSDCWGRQIKIQKHCLVYCGPERCDCGKGRSL